jgi:hypothetical protein
MKNKSLVYWCCQIGGWLTYGLSILLYTFTSNQAFSNIMYGRLVIGITFGFLFTQLLRTIILKLKLHPPMQNTKWWALLAVVLVTAFVYSVTNSVFVEWVQMYNPEVKVSVGRRTLYTFLSDTPVLLAWVSFYYLWHYIEINTNNTLDKVRLETLVKDLELKTIKSHINPHFIFNALNSIRALVDENPERARTAITQLSNILRSSMQAESLELAPMSREMDIIKDYLELEKIRFEERLNIVYDINKDTLKSPVPPMMLQTLVENALKHGIGKLKEGGTIKITSAYENSHHEMSVQNTGHIIEPFNEEGFGVSSTRSRLNLLYGKEAIFHLKEIESNVVEAKVCIPI